MTLYYLSDLDGSIESYREAIRLSPGYAEAYCNLSLVYRAKGRYDDALFYVRRGHELGTKTRNWAYPSDRWLAEAERLTEVDRAFDADRIPLETRAPGQAAAWAEVCYGRDYLYASAKLWSVVGRFRGSDRFSPTTRANARTQRLLALIRIGVGEGKDTQSVTDASREQFRRLAIRLMREDLDRFREAAARTTTGRLNGVRTTVLNWRISVGMDYVRSRRHLAKLSREEREQLHGIWTDYDELIEDLRAED